MEIRRAKTEDLTEIMEIYAQARDFMARTGNPNQWGDHYPEEELIRTDIEKEISYVAEQNGQIAAVFMYVFGDDPTYSVIEDGDWIDDRPYGVIHRIASREGDYPLQILSSIA